MSEYNRIIRAIHDMLDADAAYGCGFYNNERWRKAYDLLADLSEWEEPRTCNPQHPAKDVNECESMENDADE